MYVGCSVLIWASELLLNIIFFSDLSFDFMSPADDDEDSSPVIAEATSEPFTVFSAKKFPGMTGKNNALQVIM